MKAIDRVRLALAGFALAASAAACGSWYAAGPQLWAWAWGVAAGVSACEIVTLAVGRAGRAES
jgi:hypothetical protein